MILLLFVFCFSTPATGWAYFEAQNQPAATRLNPAPVLDLLAEDVTIELEKKSSKRPPTAPDKFKEPQAPEKKSDSFEDLQDPFAEQNKEAPQLTDPYEKYNRFMYKVNDGLAEYVLDPVTQGYKKIVPLEGRVAIKNMFANIAAPVQFINSALQGDIEKSSRVLQRLLINTTIGVGGAFDAAKDRYGLKPVNEDFGQTLATYGVPAGPYLVLPVFGPSSGRDAVGRVVDGLLNPVNYVAPVASTGMGMGDTVNTYSIYGDDKKALDQSTVDPYESIKHFYNQRREKQAKE